MRVDSSLCLSFLLCGFPALLSGCAGVTATSSPATGASGGNAVSNSSPPQVIVVNVPANDIAWDAASSELYLSVPGSAPNGNSIVPLNPYTGALGTASHVGGEPDLLSVSATGKYLYVSSSDLNCVQRLALPTLTQFSLVQLPSDPTLPPSYVIDIKASPAADDTFSIVRSVSTSLLTAQPAVVIYDGSEARHDQLCDGNEGSCYERPAAPFQASEWNGDATTLYLTHGDQTGLLFSSAKVTPDGVQPPTTTYTGNPNRFGGTIHYDKATRLVYGDNGAVLNPDDGSTVGRYPVSGWVAPDGFHGRVYFLDQGSSDIGTSTFEVESYDASTSTRLGALTIHDVIGTPKRLIRWGSSGLAFVTGDGMINGKGSRIYVINDPTFVSGTVPVASASIGSMRRQ